MQIKRNIIALLLFTVIAIAYTACGSKGLSSSYPYTTENEYQTNDIPLPLSLLEQEEPQPITIAEPPPPAIRVPFSQNLAAQYIAEIEALWESDNGTLWGAPLNVPFIIADRVTRQAVANMPDYDNILAYENGVFVGYLPSDISFFGSGQMFGGRTWYVLSWDYLTYYTDNKVQRLRRMSHGGFHAFQDDNFRGRSGRAQFADTREHRLSTFLEMYALLTALNSYGEERIAAIHDALSIRATRHQRLRPHDVRDETAHEILEGTAQYTEYVLTLEMNEILVDIRQHLDDNLGMSRAGFTFVYHGGAMYALLLSEFSANWKTELSFNTDLGSLLKEAAGITELRPFEEINLALYEYEKIVAAEEMWFERHDRIVTNARLLFAFDRPSFEIPFEADIPFPSLDQVFVSSNLILYGTFEAAGLFGTLNITNGYLQYGSGRPHRLCATDIEINGNHITGSYWELILNDGFEAVQDTSIHGTSLDSFRIVRTEHISALEFFASDRTFLDVSFFGIIPTTEASYIPTPTGLVVIGSAEVASGFGTLSVTDGYILHTQHGNWDIRVCAEDIQINGNYITGGYWELTLNSNYEVVQDTDAMGDVLNRFVVRQIQ